MHKYLLIFKYDDVIKNLECEFEIPPTDFHEFKEKIRDIMPKNKFRSAQPQIVFLNIISLDGLRHEK
jgi:hypothetical protein